MDFLAKIRSNPKKKWIPLAIVLLAEKLIEHAALTWADDRLAEGAGPLMEEFRDATVLAIAHPWWTVFVILGVYSIGVVIVAYLSALITGGHEAVYTLSFKYLPRSPLENGWTQSYNAEGVAEYGTDPDIPESLRIKIVKSEVAIHYDLPPYATLADHLAYTAKYTNSTMIFTRLVVRTRDGSAQRLVDIKFYYGDLRVVPTHPDPNPGLDKNKWLPEQTIYWPAKLLSEERLAFNIDLRKAVALSLGDQGWVFRSVQGVRLRSNLSVSPLVFSRAK